GGARSLGGWGRLGPRRLGARGPVGGRGRGARGIALGAAADPDRERQRDPRGPHEAASSAWAATAGARNDTRMGTPPCGRKVAEGSGTIRAVVASSKRALA